MEGLNQGGYREMKQEDAMKLKPKQKVIHRRYGVCFVKEVLVSYGALFGVVITPANQNGRDLLRSDTGCDIPDVLEDRPRSLAPTKPGEKPIDHEMVWGVPKEDMPQQEPKNHFAHDNEGVTE
jgi:hypothetical protein